MVISSRFQSTTDCPEPGVKAIADRGTGAGRAVAASAGVLVPATTAAMAATMRALPVLRMLCGSSRLVGRRHPSARSSGRVGPGQLLTRLVPGECSPTDELPVPGTRADVTPISSIATIGYQPARALPGGALFPPSPSVSLISQGSRVSVRAPASRHALGGARAMTLSH